MTAIGMGRSVDAAPRTQDDRNEPEAIVPGILMQNRIHMRQRDDEDNEFIQRITEQQLVPTLERAWNFKWDRGHARKFMLDLLTVGHTLVATLPDPPSAAPDPTFAAASNAEPDAVPKSVAAAEQPIAYVWYVLHPRQWRPFPRRVFWLNYLVVSPDFQGRGIGARIMEHCTEAALDAGCTSIDLWVQSINSAARRFYERLQFVPLHTQDGNVHMRKRLR